MIKSVCVFCSSSNSVDEHYLEAARRLGQELAGSKFSLVYGGGNSGLMGELARTVKLRGGKLTGVNLDRFVEKGFCYRQADEMIVVDTMRERKYIMKEKSDAFIALPGGLGTMEELLEILSLKQLHFHNSPVVIINTNNYFYHLIQLFEEGFNQRFMKPQYRSLYFVAQDAEEAVEYIKQYKPSPVPVKWS
ncbi:MAG: TIGR00730 family Rossman fold protein [Spirochaetota bacterium]